MHEFAVIEDAALAALAPLRAEGVKSLDLYVGQMEAEDIGQVTMLFPAVYVVAETLSMPENEQVTRPTVTLTLLIGDQNLRSGRAAVRGDGTSPGVYYLLERCRKLLHGKPIVPGWRTWRVTQETPLVYAPKKGVCIFGAIYQSRI
ncbi:MAG: DUF1834 family protein [Desulfobacterales bacterium]|jgi:phage gp37-like protein|nr:DUF1834 family protein [Desulfobacterales bacterium]